MFPLEEGFGEPWFPISTNSESNFDPDTDRKEYREGQCGGSPNSGPGYDCEPESINFRVAQPKNVRRHYRGDYEPERRQRQHFLILNITRRKHEQNTRCQLSWHLDQFLGSAPRDNHSVLLLSRFAVLRVFCSLALSWRR